MSMVVRLDEKTIKDTYFSLEAYEMRLREDEIQWAAYPAVLVPVRASLERVRPVLALFKRMYGETGGTQLEG